MSHVRKQIRDRVMSILDTPLAATDVGSNLFQTRFVPVMTSSMPAVLVYTPGDHLFERGYGREETLIGNLRFLDLVIDIYADGDNLDDQTDAIAVVVQKALYADKSGGRWFNGLSLGFEMADMQSEMVKSGETHYLIQRNMYKVLYEIQDGDPENAS